MTPEDEPGRGGADPQTRRWLIRLAVVAIGLWFVVDGLRGTWPAAGVVARVLLAAVVLLGVALLVMGLLHLARRGRSD
ncbi:hypothetical protein [Blastococcus deserti]|uniref:Uncharacterized protein n=1 Tax=Blastococcus deserti TaxID=2259033 RepID=A0ABW4XB94_9ACTN